MEKGPKPLLSIYYTAGFPSLDATIPIAEFLEQQGVDCLEIGFPFSDPLADGPLIQASSSQAIENGMTLSVLFKQLKNLRGRVSIPVVLMGYLNPVLQMGEVAFLEACAQVGVDGVLLPDFEKNLKVHYERLGIAPIFLITPETPEARIREIDRLSQGFIYQVASNSITGSEASLASQTAYFERIAAMDLRNPCLTGFGIHNRETFELATTYSRGAIVGSAFIRQLQTLEGDWEKLVPFLNQFRK
jgi:tryptophan synthase alpha chain